jgi:hypothetical protein
MGRENMYFGRRLFYFSGLCVTLWDGGGGFGVFVRGMTMEKSAF